MARRAPRLFAIAVMLLASPAGAQPSAGPAQSPDIATTHATRMAANPAGLSLDLRTHTGASRFAQGELITLDLEFRDASAGRYVFQPIAYDRSGRLGIDRVVIAPASAVEDPLQDYYRAMGFGFIGGGMSTPPAPLYGPRTLTLDLNEHARITRPGTYSVHVESYRFAVAGGRQEAVRVVSPQLAIEVTPRPPDAASATTLSPRALRFADTPAAARELARRLLASTELADRVGTDAFDLRFGLLGTPHRSEALDVLREGLSTMNRAVSDAVPRVAAFLDVMIALPRLVGRSDPSAAEPPERIRDRMQRYTCRVAYWNRQALAAGLRGAASDIARATVAFSEPAPSHCPPLPPVDIAGVLPAVFHQLAPEQQRLMLTYRWGDVASPAMAAVLQRLLSTTGTGDAELSDAALVRLGELAPVDAADASRHDVLSGELVFGARALQVRASDVPSVREALASHLARARDTSTPLSNLQLGPEPHARGLLPAVARFGTRQDCAVLSTWPRREPVACAAQASVIGCGFRVDAALGTQWLRDALDDRTTRCAESLPDALARLWPEVVPEQVIIDALSHDRPGVAESAARALARIGTDAGRAALWRRLDAWHARWHGQGSVTGELGLERALRESLLRARGWLPTAADRLRVRDTCVTTACREEFSPFRGGPPVRRLVVHAEEWTGRTVYYVDGVPMPSVAAVVQRLLLFPTTAEPVWQRRSSHSAARAAALYDELATAASRHGLRLLPEP